MKCPYLCSDKEWDIQTCITDPNAVPEEGSVGMCYRCGGWWELKNGQPVEFIPSMELMRLVQKELPNARANYKREVQQRLHRSR